jgi:hypothetical protein
MMTETNPLETATAPEGFTIEDVRGFGPMLKNLATGTTINWSRHYERISNGKAVGPFHVRNYKRGRLDKWTVTLEEAIELAKK